MSTSVVVKESRSKRVIPKDDVATRNQPARFRRQFIQLIVREVLMRRFLVAIICIALTTVGALAQSEPTTQRQSGSTALLVDLKGLSDLGADNYRGGLGAMTFISDDLALRAGIGFSNKLEKKNNAADEETTTLALAITPGVRYNVYNNDNVALYTGGEVTFGLGEVKNEAGGAQTSKATATTIGGGVFAGAEWFPWKHVSLMLEYGLGYKGTTSKLTAGSGTETDGPESSDIMLGLTSANFTLAWYFN
jgi:opacity protein-like surface antigen